LRFTNDIITNNKKTKSYKPLTHAYVHWLADVQFGGFAPTLTLSLVDSERSRKPQNANSLSR